MVAWPSLVLQLLVGFAGVRGEVRSCRAEYRPPWETYLVFSSVCWEQGKVLWPIDYRCYTLNGRGKPCYGDQRLVLSKSSCPEAKCQGYFSSTITRCKGRNVSYRGACVDPEDRQLCGGRLGRRLTADVHGVYSCKCSRELGYLEVMGSCYVQFSQGPCSEGEQLEPGLERPECMKNPCQADYFSGGDGTCYSVVAWKEFIGYNELTDQEKKHRDTIILELLGETPGTFCTFCNCFKKSVNGTCLERSALPEVPQFGQEALIAALASAFGLNIEETLLVIGNKNGTYNNNTYP
eukprot:TRINITY_DN74210_c0_g1_i1.p1 TRINITY_DN74210_c0_g1~~TRINITY_DN74210_c0_g1_i1.p1  ORF type:complete len:293 (-),score=59.97 TRINITY_DN74210_c0_g1_i1:425-1303(-)